MIQRLRRGDFLERRAIPWIQLFPNARAFHWCKPEENGAHRSLRRATVGSGDAGDSDGVIALSDAARAFRHFARGGFTDRAVFRECFGANAKEFALRLIAVSDKPRAKHN